MASPSPSTDVLVLLNRRIILGDLNCDERVDFRDINPFVLALSDPAGYMEHYPNCYLDRADCNGDGQVNLRDINAFVALLQGQ